MTSVTDEGGGFHQQQWRLLAINVLNDTDSAADGACDRHGSGHGMMDPGRPAPVQASRWKHLYSLADWLAGLVEANKDCAE
ncbi:MAG: hypothetical protein CL810_09665 [Cobetia sp.]|jgi:hypothetical protein|nr:hypothetical protein [Cobetia sp.]HBJ26353.1 hypothetical protein [Cobetia sp.]|tara:strand:- start:50496 stop:50738 length:243 start_codon:yes stop_codon:yes gene_type:complete